MRSRHTPRSPLRPLLTAALAMWLLPACVPDARGQSLALALQPSDLTMEQWATVDVRGGADAMAVVRGDVTYLDPAQRDRAVRSMAALQVDCPYTRASLQLALALQLEVARLEKEHLHPMVHPDLDYLKRGLADHRAVHVALDVQLPMPSEKDGLHGAPGLVDRAGLLASRDPIAATAPLVEAIEPLVEAITPEQMDRIRRNSGVVEHTTEHGYTFKLGLMSWRIALARLEPFVEDAAAKTRVQKMLELLDHVASQGC